MVRFWYFYFYTHFINVCMYNLYISPNNISVIKSRRMRWAEHVTHTGEVRGQKI